MSFSPSSPLPPLPLLRPAGGIMRGEREKVTSWHLPSSCYPPFPVSLAFFPSFIVFSPPLRLGLLPSPPCPPLCRALIPGCYQDVWSGLGPAPRLCSSFSQPIEKVAYYGNRTQFDIGSALFCSGQVSLLQSQALVTKKNALLRLSIVEAMIREASHGIGALTVGCKYAAGVPLSKVIKMWPLQRAGDRCWFWRVTGNLNVTHFLVTLMSLKTSHPRSHAEVSQ